ncbi:MAG: TonB-dependent receptor, partial [Chitinophagia bacterium]|nr:TonB-dependent receptor [Chitinophagia bacterium]
KGTYEANVNYIGFRKKVVVLELDKQRTTNLGTITLQEDSNVVREVTVTGNYRRGSELDAISKTKNSNKIVTVISAEGMQKLPDKNVAEAVQRVAGAKMERNKGEGSNISLRGTPGDWTATLINGDRMPTADEDNPSRTFEFQVFPSSLVEDIFVTRSITPDFEADNIGGAINFHTVGTPERRTLKVNLGSGANLIAGKPLYQGDVTFGDISKNKKFSYSISGSVYNRPYGADVMQLIYSNNYNHAINKLQLKDYFGTRTTLGANAAVQYKVNDRLKFGAHFMNGHMDDDKYQYRKDFNWSDGSGERIRMYGLHGVLERRLYGGDITAEWKPNQNVTVDAKIASYSNLFQYGKFPNNSYQASSGYVYFDFISPLLSFTDEVNTDFYGRIPKPGTTDVYPYKLIGADNPYGTGDSYKSIKPMPDTKVTLADYSLNSVYSGTNRTLERDPVVVQGNISWQYKPNIKIRGGVKFRSKTGSRDISQYQWYQNTGDPRYTAKIYLNTFELQNAPRNAQFLGELSDAYKNQIEPMLTPRQMGTFISRLGDTLATREMNQYNNDFRYWVGSKYSYKESVQAAYAMFEANIGDKWKVIGGIRAENTVLDQSADTTKVDADTATINGILNYYYAPVNRSIHRSYLQLLPSLNAEYAINEKSDLRLAVSRTMHRPNFEETKPGMGVYKYEDLEIIFGTPNLKPTISYNFDATYQWYIGKRDLITIGGYYKAVQDHIFTVISADTDPVTGIFFKRYANSGQSFIAGFEGSIDKHFDFLKGFWSGFGASFNITYSTSRMKVPGRPTGQALTEQTPLIYNAALYYEKGKVNTKLALNYTGPYLIGLNLGTDPATGELLHKDTDYDLFRGEMYSLDYQLSVAINKHFSAYGEANNLLDAPWITYIGQPWRPKRIEYYHQRFQVGLKFEL